MKKNYVRKLFIMSFYSLIIQLICVGTLMASTVKGQGGYDLKLPIERNVYTLKEFFDLTEQQSSYRFFYVQGNIDENSQIDINPKTKEIKKILDDIAEQESLEFKIIDDIIVVKSLKDNKLKVIYQKPKGKTITGKVTDAQGLPLPGVSVVIKDTNLGTITNADGEYTLKDAPVNATVIFSFIGMATQEVSIEGKSEINVKLAAKTVGLEEVVAVGYGTQKKASIVGAISSITPTQLNSPVAKLSTNLAGNLGGVISVQRSGEPGVGSTFWIRGISTFGANSTPLVLVDGIERDLDLVDPEDIAQFSVLKDASATAIYGVRGANGVVLITTRSGRSGKPEISVKMERGIVAPTKVPQMADAVQYAEMYNDAAGYSYYSDDAIEAYKTGSDSEFHPNVNWVEELYKNFSHNDHLNVNVTGGTDAIKYYVSGGYYDENGLFTKDNMKEYDTSVFYRRYNFRSNVDMQILKYTTLNVNLSTAFERKNEPGTSGSTIWSYALQTPSNAFPMVYSNGYYPGPGSGQGYNPYALLTQTGYVEKFWTTAQSLFGITQDLGEYVTKGLTANIKVSFDSKNYNYLGRTRTAEQWKAYRNVDGETEYSQLVKGSESLSYSESHSGHRTVYLEGSLHYNRAFGLHNLTGLFLFQQSQKNYTGVSTSEDALPHRHQGIAGRITYDYNSRYFLEGNFGYNGSENFAPGRRFGFFPSVAGGWLISEESFFQPLNHVVDMFKVRASYGLVGNDDIGGNRRFIYLETINSGGNWTFGESVHTESSIRMGDWANNSVGWEKSKKLDVGVDVSLFKKLKIQADYFRDYRTGIFLQRNSIPYYVGLTSSPYVNIGKMRNKGFDCSLEYHQNIHDFRITTRGNFTYARNIILDQDQPDYEYLYENRTGQARWQKFGYVAAGLFKDQADVDSWADQSTIGGAEPGDIKYLDLNGDGVINSYDEKAVGYTDYPEIVYGFGTSVSWKAFDFSVFFQGNAHVNFSIQSSMVQPFIASNINQSNVFSDIYNNYWTAEHTDVKYPRLTTSSNPNNNVSSTFWMVNGSYLRLKNIEFGYTLPKALYSRVGLTGLRVYFSGVNLCTFSKFKLWDPDLQTGATSYPTNTVLSLGLSASF